MDILLELGESRSSVYLLSLFPLHSHFAISDTQFLTFLVFQFLFMHTLNMSINAGRHLIDDLTVWPKAVVLKLGKGTKPFSISSYNSLYDILRISALRMSLMQSYIINIKLQRLGLGKYSYWAEILEMKHGQGVP